MKTELLDYPNTQQVFMINQEQKDNIRANVSIYDKQVTQVWLYLCLRD